MTILRGRFLHLCCLLSIPVISASQVMYRQKRQIHLTPSKHFLAIQLAPNSAVTPQSVAKAIAMKTGDVDIKIATFQFPLENKRLMVAGVTKDEQHAPSPPQLPDAKKFGTELPVYELGGADVVLTNEILVKPKDERAVQKLAAMGDVSNLDRGVYLVKLQKGKSALEVSNQLNQDEEFEFAEPNFVTLLQPPPRVEAKVPGAMAAAANNVFPSDRLFPTQWSLENSGTTAVSGSSVPTKKGADIDIKPAWKVADGNNVVIAILDVGVDTNHPDLKSKIVKTFDAFTGTTNQQPNPWDAHGTACAGIAAASTNNALGVAGAGYKASLMAVKIAYTDSAGGYWITTPEVIARGINWAIENGADILSNSWIGGDSAIVEAAIANGIQNGRNGLGAIFVFPTGDDGGTVAWPATLAKTSAAIAVSATNEWDELKSFTSKDGEGWWASNHGDGVTVAAPGVHIMTTDISGDGGYVKGDYFQGFNGTSSSVPQIAGIAALILSKDRTLRANDLKQRLMNTADPLGPASDFGAGRVNACKAVSGSGC